MAGEYVVYAYFNQSQVVSVVNAITMLMNGSATDPSSYTALIRLAGMLGLFMAMIAGIAKARGESAGMYLVIMAMFYTGLFVPKVTLTVRDAGATVYGGASADVNVDHVPIGLAVFASASSQIGHWFTQHIETTFALPDASLNFASNGLLGGARAMRMANTASAIDPDYRADVAEFMRWCINPEIVANPVAIRRLLGSTTIVADMSSLGLINPGRRVTLSDGTDYDCGYAYTEKITKPLQAAAPDWLSRLGMNVNPGLSPSQASTMMTAMLPAAQGLAGFAAQTALESLSQRIMINALNDNNGNLAQAMNDPAGVQAAVGAAQAEQQSNLSYKVMAKIGTDALPVIRNSIHLVILGCFPFVLILVIIAGDKGGKVLSNYLMGLLWVELWAPLYAIVNYITTLQAAKSMGAAKGALTGIAVSNSSAIAEAGLSAEAISGLLCVSVPVIALALVKGGEVAAASMATSLMQPSSSAAQQAGAAVGMGNISAGNLGWGNSQVNNHTGNKVSDKFVYDTGGAITAGNGNVQGFSANGKVNSVSTPTNQGPLSGAIVDNLAAAATKRASTAWSEVRSSTDALSTSTAALKQALRDFTRGRNDSSATVTYDGKSESGNDSTSGGRNLSVGQQTTRQAEFNQRSSVDAAGNLKTPGSRSPSATGGAPEPSAAQGPSPAKGASGLRSLIPLGAGMDMSYTDTTGKGGRASDASAALHNAQELVSHADGYLSGQTGSTSSTGANAYSDKIAALRSEVLTASNNLQRALQQATQYEEGAQAARSLQTAVAFDRVSDAASTDGSAYLNILEQLRRADSPEAFQATATQLREQMGMGSATTSAEPPPSPKMVKPDVPEMPDVTYESGVGKVDGKYENDLRNVPKPQSGYGFTPQQNAKLKDLVPGKLADFKSRSAEMVKLQSSIAQGDYDSVLKEAGMTSTRGDLEGGRWQMSRLASAILNESKEKNEQVGTTMLRYAKELVGAIGLEPKAPAPPQHR